MNSLENIIICSGNPVNLAPKHFGLRFKKSCCAAMPFKLMDSRSLSIRLLERMLVRLEGGVPQQYSLIELFRELFVVFGWTCRIEVCWLVVEDFGALMVSSSYLVVVFWSKVDLSKPLGASCARSILCWQRFWFCDHDTILNLSFFWGV